jgi:hypothetical protein
VSARRLQFPLGRFVFPLCGVECGVDHLRRQSAHGFEKQAKPYKFGARPIMTGAAVQ